MDSVIYFFTRLFAILKEHEITEKGSGRFSKSAFTKCSPEISRGAEYFFAAIIEIIAKRSNLRL